MNTGNTGGTASGPHTIRTERVGIQVGDDGPPMGGYLARPATPGPFPGVVVAMELFGVDAAVRDVCNRLATLGFTALAPDLHHRTAPGTELPRDPAGRERGFELLELMTRTTVLDDVRACIEHLRASGSERVGMVGLSIGGHIAYLAATAFDLASVAVLYGGWLPTTDIPLSRPEPTLSLTPAITARVLFLVGENDHVVPPAHQREIARALREAGIDHEFVVYPGTGHGFLSTDPATASDAWNRVHTLLADAGA
ncbi:dienelactone hydrolase family protein [Streptomyces sp. NRRL WC-3742]|uniref:dienelactone hydrolase family protein n=1 Tax=Streptomyces sp. NRRL WC-3742 TaxID=1463934 RepID=UPI0004C7D4D2|nr:dienelactone hydrolase family protein [Streptomyces sp. NRRL WC-3742]